MTIYICIVYDIHPKCLGSYDSLVGRRMGVHTPLCPAHSTCSITKGRNRHHSHDHHRRPPKYHLHQRDRMHNRNRQSRNQFTVRVQFQHPYGPLVVLGRVRIGITPVESRVSHRCHVRTVSLRLFEFRTGYATAYWLMYPSSSSI